MKLEPMTEAEASKVYKEWLNTPGSANEFDLIRMAVSARDEQWRAAILADREKRAQPVEYQVLGFVSRYGTEIHDTLEAAAPGQPVYVRIATEASKPVQDHIDAPIDMVATQQEAPDRSEIFTLLSALDVTYEEAMADELSRMQFWSKVQLARKATQQEAQPHEPARGDKEDAERAEIQASPTAGMTIEQRILHVGGRNNAAGYVEFGSTQAVQALVRQVLRDLPRRAPLPADVIVTMYAESPSSDSEMVEFAREIERAHGIAARAAQQATGERG